MIWNWFKSRLLSHENTLNILPSIVTICELLAFNFLNHLPFANGSSTMNCKAALYLINNWYCSTAVRCFAVNFDDRSHLLPQREGLTETLGSNTRIAIKHEDSNLFLRCFDNRSVSFFLAIRFMFMNWLSMAVWVTGQVRWCLQSYWPQQSWLDLPVSIFPTVHPNLVTFIWYQGLGGDVEGIARLITK